MSFRPRKTTRFVGVLGVALLTGIAALSASAGSGFLDVPDDHVHAGAIEWMRESGITKGCNPPANTRFCPEDNTTRAQMSTFLSRLATGRIVDAGTLDGFDSSDFAKVGDAIGDADTLDGKDSTEFLGVNDKAADSDLLDGKDSSEFLAVNGKAADSDLLDGFDSSDFAKVGDAIGDADTLDGKDSTEFLGSTVTVREATDQWALLSVTETRASCNAGEVVTGGGYSSNGITVNVTDNYPDGSDWVVKGTISVLGDVTAYVICSAVG